MTQAAALTTAQEEDDLIMGKEEGDHWFWEGAGLLINSSRIKKTCLCSAFSLPFKVLVKSPYYTLKTALVCVSVSLGKQ